VPRNLSRELLRRGRLPPGECLALILPLADALGFLHGQQLIHRDVKPSNIIFVRGVPKLADIGLVTAMNLDGSHATLVGTEGYLAPEGPGQPTADVYSLGKVLYEIHTGLDCFHFPELPAAPGPGREQAGFFALNAIVLKACDPDHRKRYPSAAELHAALLEYQRQFPLVSDLPTV
jgi:serine/threonine protein kinase